MGKNQHTENKLHTTIAGTFIQHNDGEYRPHIVRADELYIPTESDRKEAEERLYAPRCPQDAPGQPLGEGVLPTPPGEANALITPRRGPGRPRGKPKTRRHTKLAVMGIPSDSLEGADPHYAHCVRQAAAYRKVRERELYVSHGYVSAGASALLATASLALAASRFLYERATKAGPDLIPSLLKQASQLADSARANELSAWELCAREAVQRKKTEAASSGVPWIVAQADKTGAGRPRKDRVGMKEAVGMLIPATTQEGGSDAGNNG